MKLLLLNWQDRTNPLAGGAEIHLHEIFGRLAARGVETTLLASGFGTAPPEERIDGIRVVRAGGRYSYNARAIAEYRRRLATQPFDLVVEALNKVPLFSPLWSRSPVVLLVHHLFGATAFREASVPLAAATWLLERPIGRVYRGVPAQAISRSTADDLVGRGLAPEDIRVIHPGVDLDFFTPDAGMGRAEEPTFLYLGRLKRYKRIDLLLRAAARLAEQGVRVRLEIAGSGDQRGPLERLAHRLELGGRVVFHGRVTEQEKRELFRRAWAHVFPSPKEGWGMTCMEAAACGTATVASDSPGLREAVVHDSTGLLVPHGDLDALTRALRRFALEPELADTLGAGALRFAAAFGWDRVADQTQTHLQEALRQGRRGRPG